MRLCKNCRYWKGTEHSVESDFRHISKDRRDEIDEAKAGRGIITPSCQTVSEGGFCLPIKMCHHEICFTPSTAFDPERGPVQVSKRISGQGFLNDDGLCYLYERKRWKFWVGGDGWVERNAERLAIERAEKTKAGKGAR